ncbi:MAG: hypothetical protein U0166_03440 [Acidobacteriota bacterium]
MRITWIAPLPPSESPLAGYAIGMLPAVREWTEIAVWTTQTAWDPVAEDLASVQTLDPKLLSWMGLNRAEMSVLHLADEPASLPAWRLSYRHRCVVVLHADSYVGLFGAAEEADRPVLRSWMEGCRGLAGADDCSALLDGRHEGLAERYPWADLAARGALAVVTPAEASSPAALCNAVTSALGRRAGAGIEALAERADRELASWMPPSRDNPPPHVAAQVRAIGAESAAMGERFVDRAARAGARIRGTGARLRRE